MSETPQRDLIAQKLLNNPAYKQRKNRYIFISELLASHYGIVLEPKDCKLVCSLADEYRHQTDADEVGVEKEKEWHAKPFMFEWQYEMQGRKKLAEAQDSLF